MKKYTAKVTFDFELRAEKKYAEIAVRNLFFHGLEHVWEKGIIHGFSPDDVKIEIEEINNETD